MKERLFWLALWVGTILLLILYFTKCNQKSCPEIKKIVYDTTIVKGKDSIAWRTIPNKTDHDTFIEYSPYEVIKYRDVDTAAILRDYFVTRYYEDTSRLQYADVITKDSITQNKNLRHKVEAIWKIPVVTKTVTYMQPKKSEWYGGLDFGYNNVGANLSFKDTSNRIWEAGAFYAGKMYYYIGRKWQIKLHK